MLYLKWAYWMAYYYFLPPKDFQGLMRQIIRTRTPWWKFKPGLMHNDDGGFWEIFFEDEMPCTWNETIEVRAMRAHDSDNRIVGLQISDSQLRPKSLDQLIEEVQSRPQKSGPKPRLLYVQFRSADDKSVEAEGRIIHEREELPEGVWSVTHADSDAAEVMSAGEMPEHWRRQLVKWGQIGESIRE